MYWNNNSSPRLSDLQKISRVLMGSLFVTVDDPRLRVWSDLHSNLIPITTRLGLYLFSPYNIKPEGFVCLGTAFASIAMSSLPRASPDEGNKERIRVAGVPMTLKRLTGSTSLLQTVVPPGVLRKQSKRMRTCGLGNLPRLIIVGWQTTAERNKDCEQS